MAILMLLMFVHMAAAQTDRTLEERATGAMVVDAVVDKIQRGCIFPNDRLFLRRIAVVESQDGLNTDTFRAGYYGGIWQVSETAFQQTQDANANPDFPSAFNKIQDTFGITWQNVTWSDLTKPLYSGLAARFYISITINDIPWSLPEQAEAWAHNYTASGLFGAHFATAVCDPEEECNVPKADITFVLDTSGSIGSTDFKKVKAFVADVVNSFTIGPDNVRIGMVTYSTSSIVEFTLGRHSTKARVLRAVDWIRYRGGGTNTDRGLDDLRTVMANQRNDPVGVARIAIVMTDGKSKSSVNKAAQRVHDDDIETFAVGVTSDINQAELETIGSQPSCVHVFNLASFSDVTKFKSEIIRRSCKVPAKVDVGQSFFGVLTTGQFKYITIDIDVFGFTFKLSSTSGAVVLYLSYSTPNPSAALYDIVIGADVSTMPGARLFVPYGTGKSPKIKPVYVSIYGAGAGETNDYNLEIMQGDQSKAGAGRVANMAALTLLSCVLLILM